MKYSSDFNILELYLIRGRSIRAPHFLKKEEMMALAPITQAIEEIRLGKIIVLVDDENRENEGDLVMAAQSATPDAVAFMAIHGRGLVCLTLEAEKIARLKSP